MSEGTQSLDLSRTDAPIAAAAVVGFNAARPLFQYRSSLLRLWGGNAAKVLLRQSSLLRLWADTAPKPFFEFQSSLLRLWADNCEQVARAYENRVEALGTALDQQQFRTPLQNLSTRLSEDSEAHGSPLGRNQLSPPSEEIQQDNKPADRMSDLANGAVEASSETSLEVTAQQAKTGVATHAAVSLEEAAKTAPEATKTRQQTAKKSSQANKTSPAKRISSTKKIARKTMRSRDKTGRK
jgi:hypothetical protein